MYIAREQQEPSESREQRSTLALWPNSILEIHHCILCTPARATVALLVQKSVCQWTHHRPHRNTCADITQCWYSPASREAKMGRRSESNVERITYAIS